MLFRDRMLRSRKAEGAVPDALVAIAKSKTPTRDITAQR
jgi:hypothetical protein